jgi:Na+-transporting NADH:ubiquinone oxidoreductase subunit C
MALNKDSKTYTLFIAAIICLVGSILVSTAAVVLKPRQIANQLQDRQINILRVAGLYEPGMDTAAVFEKRVDAKVIDFTTGDVAEDKDPATFDAKVEASDPENRITLTGAEDIAGVGNHAKYGLIYLVRNEENQITRIVVPIHGYGLWSTMYAFLALEADADTVAGISYYQQAETPGLGGEVENPRWAAQWEGKQIYDEDGDVALRLVRGGASSDDQYGVDALSGATLTSNGVTNSVRYWLSKSAYRAYLEKVSKGNADV